MFGSACLAILGHLGPSWAHLGPCLQPSCHPTSPLDTSKSETRAPKPHFASFAKPSTCLEHCYLRWFSGVNHLSSLHHVTLSLALHNPKIQAQSYPQTPQDWPQRLQDSPRWPRNGPQNVRQSMGKSGDHMFGNPCLAILGHLGPSWLLFRLSSSLLAANLPRKLNLCRCSMPRTCQVEAGLCCFVKRNLPVLK